MSYLSKNNHFQVEIIKFTMISQIKTTKTYVKYSYQSYYLKC